MAPEFRMFVRDVVLRKVETREAPQEKGAFWLVRRTKQRERDRQIRIEGSIDLEGPSHIQPSNPNRPKAQLLCEK